MWKLCKIILTKTTLFTVLTQLLLFAFTTEIEAQQGKKRITGIVTDSANEPLIGVAVRIQNTSIATITNLEGLFVIDAKESDVLHFSYLGFASQEVKVGRQTLVNVSLKADNKLLEDVVVVGYGKQKRAAMVSSLSTVDSKAIVAPTSNITANLAGQLSGLISVQRTAEPGRDDAEFWIRGVSSFAGGTQPLILVDGVPRSISELEADEIETFSVLKDAAATAVYGAEGANGVMLVTTKRGIISKPKISFRAENTFASPQRLPQFVNSGTYLDLANEANYNDGFDPYMGSDRIDLYRSGVDNDLYPNTNWIDELIDTSVKSQRYTLGFRGGAENARYFVSLAYLDQDGIFKANPMGKYNSDFGYQRYNLRSNVDLRVSKTTKLSIDISGQYTNRLTANRSPDDIFKFMLFTPPHLFPAIYSDGVLSTYKSQSDGNNRNPYNMLYNQGYRKEYGTSLQSTATINQDLHFVTPGLSANAKLSFDYDGEAATLRNYWPTLYNAVGRDGNGNLVYNTSVSGSPELSDPEFTANEYRRKIYIEASLNYQRTIKEHSFSAMALYMQKEEQRHNPVLPIRKQGLVGRMAYGFDDRYFIEGSFGYTGSYQFAKGNRFGFFPAVGVSYYLSNEPFYSDAMKEGLSTAKIRVSIGRTGNDVVDRNNTMGSAGQFIYRPTFKEDGPVFNQGIGSTSGTNGLGNGIRDLRPPNYGLQWEIELKRNIGIDLGFLNNKIELTADYFNNERSSILIRRNTITGIAGFHERPWENYGIVNNWGVDASLNATHSFGDFKVSARGTFTFARNKIIENDEVPKTYAYQNEIGSRVNDHFVYIAERLYNEDDFVKTQNSNSTYSYALKPGLPEVSLNGRLGPGDIKFKDVNLDGVINNDDKVRGVGYPVNPEIVYGFGLNVEWKGAYVSAFFQGAANTSILMSQSSQTYVATSPFSWGIEKSNYRTAFLDRWTTENPSQDAYMPRIHSHYSYDINKEPNTWWLKNGNFLRFKNLEVGYSFPRKMLSKIKIENLRLYLLGYNLHLWDSLKLWDPEQGQRNVAGMSYPMSRSLTVGIDFNF